MKAIVEEYARGEFEVKRPEVEISVARLALEVEAGTLYRGSFTIKSANDMNIKLMVFDSRYLIDFKSHTFVGRKNEIAFSFNAENIEPGKTFVGNINVVSDGGEFRIPYNIEVVEPMITVGDKKIKDLFQFAAFAEEAPGEALTVFLDDDFKRVFLKDKDMEARAYHSLRKCVNMEQAMEDFLVYTHKKRALTLQAAEKEILIEMPTELVRAGINISKNTWGYVKAAVRSDCDFLMPEMTEIDRDSFTGNNCKLTFLINPDRIKDGVNTGNIYVENPYQTICIKIGIKLPDTEKVAPKVREMNLTVKRDEEAIVRAYIDFRTDRIDLSKYIDTTKICLVELLKFRPEMKLYRLGLLHMNILEGRIEYAKHEFERIDSENPERKDGDMERCYYSYLKALVTRDETVIEETAAMTRECFRSNRDKLFYFWILLFIDIRYTEDKWTLYEDIRTLYDMGINSPVIYFEICDMFNKQPLMCKQAGLLEISAIRWGMRHDFISEDVLMEYIKACGRLKNFDEHAFKLLEEIYEVHRFAEALNVICGILIRNHRYDMAYHEYYRKALEDNLKYIGLNECFLKSMDKSRYDLIPEAILRYFLYKNTLDEKELAYLYANIIMNKEANGSVYNEYTPSMTAFMEKMIVKGEVSDDLTVIYDEFLEPETVSEEFAPTLINIIFRRKFVCRNKNIKTVVVSHGELKDAQVVNVKNGEAYVEIVSKDVVLTLLDGRGGRYAGSVGYRLERIVDEKSYMDICKEYNFKDYRYLLCAYNNIDSFDNKDSEHINIARNIIACPELSDKIRQQAVRQMISYYHENYDGEILAKYMLKLDLDYVKPYDSTELTEYMVELELMDMAFDMVMRFGYMDVAAEPLVKLAEYGIGSKKYEDTRELISMCVYLYKRGYATKNILSFLGNNFNGSTTDMADLFKSVSNTYRDIDMLAENILAQSMFANGYTESIYDIFDVYYKGRSRGMVIKAFLRYCAHQYLIKEQKIPANVMECLYCEIEKMNITDEISRMALLYFFSNCGGHYNREQKEWIRKNVKAFVSAGKILPFFRAFVSFVTLPGDTDFKTYIIFKGEKDMSVWISYSFGNESVNMAKYKSERMNEIIPGVYVKEVVVFHGENLVYSIDCDESGRSSIVESEALKNKPLDKGSSNRFELINHMLISQETRDDQALMEAMETYLNNIHFFEENLIIL